MLGLASWLSLDGLTTAAEINSNQLPPPAQVQIEFDRDIRPILEASCFRCHGPERPKSKFRLDNRESALKGGDNGVDIKPGNSAGSPLIHYVAGLVEDIQMPPPGKGNRLTAEQIGLLRAWIDQGAPYPASATGVTAQTLFSASPIVGWAIVSGNAAKFREHWWLPDGASGGLESFSFRESLTNGQRFSAEGRMVADGTGFRSSADARNYGLKLAYEKDEVGFMRGGVEQFRKWYDDTGGAYEPFQTPATGLGRDLYLDNGRAWFEAGLWAPNYPRITIGYEYQYRQGTEPTLEWGLVSNPAGGTPKAIYPAYKQVGEKVHEIKLDASHVILGVGVEDSFRGEFFDAKWNRFNADSYTLGNPAPDSVTHYAETYSHFQGANALRLEKPIRDWLYVSGGYLYSRLDGQSSFSMESFVPSDLTIAPFVGDVGDQIILRQESHVFNLNSLLGPWQGLTFATGLQSEWMRQQGFGHAVVNSFPTAMNANLDRFSNDEQFTLRYTKIPFTVLFAETHFQQVSLGQYERNAMDGDVGDPHDFLRDTDAQEDLKEFKLGATLSPWQSVALSATYRRQRHRSDYQHVTDTDASNNPNSPPGNGYPAFILARLIDTEEVETKLVWHALSWLKATLKYQLLSSAFDTATEPGIDQSSGLPFLGGRIRAGLYDANVYSINATLTPHRRLYLATTFAYSDSRTVTADNNDVTVAPYRGDIYTVISSANFALNQQTDLQASYSFSRAAFAQDNFGGLPLGLDYDRHGLTAGVTRHFKRGLTANLEYGFFHYTEPTSGGAGDYAAHTVFVMLTKQWP